MSQDNDWMKRVEREVMRWADESIRDFFEEAFYGNSLWHPRVDVYETAETVVVRVCAPGVASEKMDISLGTDGRTLLVRGVREDDPHAREGCVRYHQIEIYTGPFQRSIPLPSDVQYDLEQIAATHKDGFFVITLPKKVDEISTPRTVPITAE